jgi:hypothetical protein
LTRRDVRVWRIARQVTWAAAATEQVTSGVPIFTWSTTIALIPPRWRRCPRTSTREEIHNRQRIGRLAAAVIEDEEQESAARLVDDPGGWPARAQLIAHWRWESPCRPAIVAGGLDDLAADHHGWESVASGGGAAAREPPPSTMARAITDLEALHFCATARLVQGR